MGSSISTYGMVGVGIAAAIGFVFALTILNNSSAPLDITSGDGQELAQQRRVETQPAAPSSFLVEQQQQEEAPSSTTTGQQEEEDGGGSGSAARLSKEQSRDTGESGSAGQETTLLLQEQPATTTTESLPALSSLTAVNGTSRQVIGEVTPGMVFATGRPVFFKANFVNPSETEIVNHTIIMSLVRNGSEASQTDNAALSYERVANFQGDIGANGSVKLELYWNPDMEGEYVLSVLSLTPSDISDPDSIEPLLSIAIKAREE